MFQDPNTKTYRAFGVGYYERLRIENEFRNATDKHMFENEVERRFQRHQMEKEKTLNERRERLARLLQCEERQNRELGRQKLEHERLVHRELLFQEAKRLKDEVEKMNVKDAEEGYQLQFIKANLPLRERFAQQHLAEIMKDRKEIAALKAWDKYYRDKEDAILEGQKTLLDEQLEREERELQKAKDLAYSYAAQYLADISDKSERKAIEKRKQDEDERKQYELLKQENAIKEKSLEEQRKTRRALLQELQKNVEESKKRKEEEQRKEGVVEAYCSPLLESNKKCVDPKKKEALRQEQLRFMEYQKSVARNEQCYDKYLDYKYAEINAEKREQEKRKRQQERERSIKLAKEIVADQKEMVSKKLEAQKAEKLKRIEAEKELRRKLKEQEELSQKEERERHEKVLRYTSELIQQQNYNRAVKDKIKQQELEREREAMAKAEDDYNKRMKEAMEHNTLMLKIHPWRRALISKNR